MADLTEQWKKGELPEGHYYIKNNKKIEIEIDEYVQWYKDHGIPSGKSFAYFNVTEVLAPVPSYEEWKAVYEYEKYADNEIKNLKQQNAQLKELLKKVKDYLPEFETPMDILAKIDEVLK